MQLLQILITIKAKIRGEPPEPKQ